MLNDMVDQSEVTIDRDHARQLETVLAKLTAGHRDAMFAELTRRLDGVGHTTKDFVNSSWVPGSNWEGTPFEPLFDACAGLHPNQEKYAGWMFGWMLRSAIIKCEDKWEMYKHHDPAPGMPRGTYYCRADRTKPNQAPERLG